MSIDTPAAPETELEGEPAPEGSQAADVAPEADGLAATIAGLRATFDSGRTRDLAWRRRQLQGVIDLLQQNEQQLVAAMAVDVGKPAFDAWLTDLLTTRDEAAYALEHLDEWAEPTKYKVPVVAQPGTAWTQPQPLGVVLVIAPWNYPVQLLLSPLVGALAAGNAALLKPSELAPATSAAIAALVPKYLDPDAVAVVEGGVDVTTELLAEPWDHILFTGSTRVGKVVMAAAAKHLTPVTLELGGKSPTIVAADADLKVAAKRVAWAKYLNAGQTCIAPDYVLVERSVEDRFTKLLVDELGALRDGAEPASIVNGDHVARLEGLLDGHGGEELLPRRTDAAARTVDPVVVREPDPASPLMTEEIFGPLLPILAVDSVDDAIAFVQARPRPLALYLFSSSRDTERQVLERTIAGSVCVNHLVYQCAVSSLPFGGVGPSGIGGYHGKAGFDTFSHHKSVLRRPTKGDLSLMYPPYSKTVQKALRLLTRWPKQA
ncbi:aldehyde dehydrogenase family protein [Aquihabitans sp. G128]|uniref:aldehyde dehydrogenase family protein n=1 Tax=Aquihabitans sp. G128 TaxID=2849779 RepID=UPI001C2166C4|nr:aldehyde dehydrogenase family protein [Aquihabitans sp. G128]QXC59978.1 aldehyde dehydrogenase family protein [Aquihabitans sp. G128]